MTANKFGEHCLKSYFGPYFPAFGLNTDGCGQSLRIQSECRKMRIRITSNIDTSHAVEKTSKFLTNAIFPMSFL